MFRKLIPLLAAPVVLGAQQMQQPMQKSSDTTFRRQSVDTSFRPISLADALRLAKENNVGNLTAANAVRSSNLQVRSARAQLYPNVTVSAGQGKSAGDRLG